MLVRFNSGTGDFGKTTYPTCQCDNHSGWHDYCFYNLNNFMLVTNWEIDCGLVSIMTMFPRGEPAKARLPTIHHSSHGTNGFYNDYVSARRAS